MNIIFFGSDDFALAHLNGLISSSHQVLACVTQPDKAKGRGLKVVNSPIKECAQKHRVPVLQPPTLKENDFIKEISSFGADVFIVIAYGKFLPAAALNIPKIFSLNVHASLLPKYRGAAPINWAIINGEKETGITIIKINEMMDAGDILAQKKVKIDDEDTSITLRSKMMDLSPGFLLKTLEDIERQRLSSVPQDGSLATLAPKLNKDTGKIDWNKPAGEIHNLVRGLLPWPCAYTFYNGKMLKILEAAVLQQETSKYQMGEIIAVNTKGFVVAASQSGLLIKRVHLESSKAMDAASFINGYKLKTGERLG